MSDEYRDDLAAAHERIAVLEAALQLARAEQGTPNTKYEGMLKEQRVDFDRLAGSVASISDATRETLKMLNSADREKGKSDKLIIMALLVALASFIVTAIFRVLL